ncbi:RNA-guided endonuclease InsQ/TnpB family protein [Cupriavidus consociatus]|uniref:RNA-guided endonuclease InsQ/TnpB family protein n=1 Tax=Cupriavidus consociatus TaxID=2821357 RepID=UPI0024736A51|nr:MULTISPECIES: transposase [unclassified Cupriavidus]MDK2658650.1 transposase [Cupriavidus sp. LEh21]
MARCNTPVRVLRLRLKDKHASALSAMAREVNFVWNYCNELSYKIFERERRFASGIELQRYLNGASKEGLGIGSAVFQQIAEEYATRRRQHRKVKLRWRKSGGARRSLGWIPFKARSIVWRNGQVHFQGLHLGLWDSYGLSSYELGAGTISEDSRGRWFLNVTVRSTSAQRSESKRELGIDLGLKTFAGFSDQNLQNVEAQRFYRDLEPALATAQRARKKARVKAIHAKIANRRKDFLHQLSTKLAREYGAIFVGNVNAQALARSQHAKSVLDAGWSAFRTMLQYKCADAGVWFDEVDEAFSSQTCSCCGSRTGPKGIAGLGIREWTCSECGTIHDRDRNAARNILAVGRDRLAGGISVLSAPGAAAAG